MIAHKSLHEASRGFVGRGLQRLPHHGLSVPDQLDLLDGSSINALHVHGSRPKNLLRVNFKYEYTRRAGGTRAGARL